MWLNGFFCFNYFVVGENYFRIGRGIVCCGYVLCEVGIVILILLWV